MTSPGPHHPDDRDRGLQRMRALRRWAIALTAAAALALSGLAWSSTHATATAQNTDQSGSATTTDQSGSSSSGSTSSDSSSSSSSDQSSSAPSSTDQTPTVTSGGS